MEETRLYLVEFYNNGKNDNDGTHTKETFLTDEELDYIKKNAINVSAIYTFVNDLQIRVF